MPIGPEQQLSNLQFVQLLQRQSWVDSATIPCAAGYTELLSAGFNFQIARGQAIRIVSLCSRLTVPTPAPNGIEISNWGVLITISTPASALAGQLPVRALHPLVNTSFAIGTAGALINYQDQELIYWNDFLEYGGTQSLTCTTVGDIVNTDSVSRNMTFATVLLIERFQISTTSGHVGYSP